MNKRALIFAAALSSILSIFAGNAFADGHPGYLNDIKGDIVKSNFGLCWRTGFWTPAMAVEECDSDLVKTETPPPAETYTAPPAAKPKPEAVMTKKKVHSQVTFQAESLFDFDKSNLKPEGKAALDDLLGKIHGVDVELIVVTGYTDRIGTADYNQKLSERRAETVKNYLVANGIDASVVRAEGKGKSDPVTQPGDCKGKGKGLIQCLQPDRRVEVEVKGTEEVMEIH